MPFFGEYKPDIPDRDNDGLTVAKNCVPHAASYKQISQPVVYSSALNERCQGFIAVKNESGNVYNFAGDDTDLYTLTAGGTTWSEISSSTGAYSTASTGTWEFAQWGNTVIAVNGVDSPQAATIDGTDFATLSGSPPIAKHIGIVRDFVVLGNLAGDDPTKLHWSAINDSTVWTAGTNQSDTQNLQSGGKIQRVVGGEYGVIFCETSIYRMTYAGYPLVFQFDEVEPGRGTPAPNSVVRFGDAIFYLGRDGFYMFNGQVSTPIGANRVDKTFYSDLDTNYYERITGTIDPINTLVFWSYPGEGSTSGTPNKIIAYNWTTNRWAGPIETTHEILVQSFTMGTTLDALTTTLGYTNIDLLPYSLDSRIWQGGEVVLSVFNSDHKLSHFTGDAFDATFETGELSLNSGGRAMVTGLRPLFDGTGTATAQIGSRNTVNGTTTWSAESAMNSQTELCPFRVNARYHRARIKITGGFSHAYGYDPEFVAAGSK